MKLRTIGIIAILVLAAGLELFYFRFHTYFQRTEVQETPPPMASGAPAAMQPRTIAQGMFGEVDRIHKGSGTAKLIEQGGERFLRFENFEVTNGPDLFVYLVESPAPGGTLESLGAYADLGRLKGNAGNQNYAVGSVPDSYRTAVIWCKEFGVLFSYAVLR